MGAALQAIQEIASIGVCSMPYDWRADRLLCGYHCTMDLLQRSRWIDTFVMQMSKRFPADSAPELSKYAADVWIYRRHEAPVDAVENQRAPGSEVKFWPALRGVDAWFEAQTGVYMAIDPRNAWDDCQEAAHIAYLEDRDTIDADPVAAIERIYSSLP